MVILSSPGARTSGHRISPTLKWLLGEADSLRRGPQLSRVCTSCGQVWLRAFPDQFHILTPPELQRLPRNSRQSLGLPWEGEESRGTLVGGGEVRNSRSLECPKVLRLFLRHQVSASRHQSFRDWTREAAPCCRTPVGDSYGVYRFERQGSIRTQPVGFRNPKRLGEGRGSGSSCKMSQR